MQITRKDRILDISVNLARVSDWILSESPHKQRRVDQFLQETQEFILELSKYPISSRFEPTLRVFKKEFEKLLHGRSQDDKLDWAERALTWANILQHRAKLA